MGYQMPDRPRFLETALQGLAFWIGHRQAMFPFYPLSPVSTHTTFPNAPAVFMSGGQSSEVDT